MSIKSTNYIIYKMNFILETNRLLLRNLQESDLDDFLFYRSNPEITQYQNFDTYNKKQAEEFILSQKKRRFGIEAQWIQLAIILKSDAESDNKLIGDCAVKLQEDTAEIGCTISHQFQKKGYAKEVLLMLMKYLFEERNIRRIVENTAEENIASQKLLDSLGFRKEGHFVENVFSKGRLWNELQYAMLKREWDLLKK